MTELEQFLESEEDISQRQYEVLSSQITKYILELAGEDDSMLPTFSEITESSNPRRSFFAYNNPQHIQSFIEEEKQKTTDFLGAFILILLY